MGLFKSNDDDDDSFTEQKVWLNPGNSGIAMASSNEKHSTTTTPSPQPQAPTVQPDYSGLQVVESGLEVAGSDQSEALSAGSVPSSQHPFHHHHHHHVNGSAGQGSPFDTTTTTTTSQASPPLRYAEQKGYDWHGAPPPQVVPIEQSGMGGGHRLYSASTGTSQPPPPAQQHQYLGGHNPFDPAAGKPGRKPTICGLKRKLFWGLVAVIIFVIVLAIGVGVGVGLAVKNSSTSSTSSSANSTASSTSTATPTSSTSTSTTLTPTATATADANSDILCPSANLTLYELATSTDTKYLVLCGRDYNSDGGAIDITSVNSTFEGCLNTCGDTNGCVAVGWGNYYGTDTCWLKSQIGTPNWSSDWYAAVLDDSG